MAALPSSALPSPPIHRGVTCCIGLARRDEAKARGRTLQQRKQRAGVVHANQARGRTRHCKLPPFGLCVVEDFGDLLSLVCQTLFAKGPLVICLEAAFLHALVHV